MKNICYESTKECNLKCDYCISSDNGRRGEKEIDYVQIIDKISKFSPKRIVISGGEPLMDRKLLDKLKLIRVKCPNSFVSISTNGSIPFDFLKLKEYIDCLDFSLPALDKNIYIAMRGKDFVDQVVQNIINAINGNFNVRLSYMLTKVNSGELKKILDFAENKKISEVRIGRFFPFRDAQLCKDKYELSESQIEQIMNNVKKKNYSFRIVPPIKNLDLMENGYVTINYCGEVFFPTREGKRHIGCVNDLNESNISNIVDEQNKIFINTNMEKDKHARSYYNAILRPMRIRESAPDFNRSIIEEFYSDRSRIIYSQAFRRLQQKAQVFSLETNSSVRSRLSHSIEVSDVGRLMTLKITEKLCKLPERDTYHLEQDDAEKIVAIVENACLLHDIGNPPFGHFGEVAIQNWWTNNCEQYLKLHNERAKEKSEDIDIIKYKTVRQQQLLADIKQFDGNPQGIRTILRLRKDEEIKEEPLESGMNLSYQTILSCVKYVICAGEPVKSNVASSLQKKAGYFQSEKNILTKMYTDLGISMDRRFPFVYIMEAADDISYCMSDVADSIEKGLTSLKDFLDDFCKIWKAKYNEEVPEDIIKQETRNGIKDGTIKDFNYSLASKWAANMTSEAARIFVEKRENFFNGIAEEVIKEESTQFRVLQVISEYSRKKIYRAVEAEGIEIAGYAVISGLLTFFGRLLILTEKEFHNLLNPDFNPKKENLQVESRICHLLGNKYITSYKNQLKEWKNRLKEEELQEGQVEWWLRAHLVVDHVAGMTDEFALKTYQLCQGIDVSMF